MNNLLKCYTTNYANFSARMGRKDFWIFLVFTIIVTFVLNQIDLALNLGPVLNLNMQGSAHAGGASFSGNDHEGFGILSTIFIVISFLPVLSAQVRRLHDTDRSGWWVLMGLIPLVGMIVLAIFFLLQGTQGANKHGAAV